jgi:hypothetical protein
VTSQLILKLRAWRANLKSLLKIVRKDLWAYLMVLSAMALIPFLSFNPPPCTRAVTGPLSSNLIFNCDSAQFMQDSQNPSRLMNSETSYQDRPLYALLAKLISIPLKPLISGSQSFTNSKGVLVDFFLANLIAFWIIHFVVLFIALSLVLIFLKGVSNVNFLTKVTVVSLFFINDLTKSFFWTPHTQLFSLLLMSLSLYSWKRFQKPISQRFALGWFSSISLLMFFYPIYIIALVIPLVINFRRFLVPCFFTLVPYLVYPWVLTLLGGKFRRTTTEDFDQFIWILRDDGLRAVVENFPIFLRSFSTPYVLAIAVLGVYLCFTSIRNPVVLGSTKSLAAISMFLVAYLSFLFLIGLYAVRLTVPFIAGLVSLLVVRIGQVSPKRVADALTLCVLGLIAYGYIFGQMIS